MMITYGSERANASTETTPMRPVATSCQRRISLHRSTASAMTSGQRYHMRYWSESPAAIARELQREVGRPAYASPRSLRVASLSR
jgi:hypothetical protein